MHQCCIYFQKLESSHRTKYEISFCTSGPECGTNQIDQMPAPKPISRAAQAAEVLRREAEERGPGSRLSSVRELSSKLGFSQASLATALARLESEGVLVRRHGSGIYAASKVPAGRIVVAIASHFLARPNQSPFWHLVLSSVLHEVAERGWEAICFVGNPEASPGKADSAAAALPSAWLKELESGRSICLISLGLSDAEVKEASSKGCRVVSYAGYGEVMVARDLAKMTESGINALKDIGEGPILVAPLEPYSTRLAMKGIKRSLVPDVTLVAAPTIEEAPEPPTFRHCWTRGMEDPIAAARTWLEVHAPAAPFRLVSLDDMFTAGVLSGMSQLGLQLGKDVVIATHSNKGSDVLSDWNDRLIRLQVDPAEAATKIVTLMDQAAAKGSWKAVGDAAPPDRTLQSGEFIYHIGFRLIPLGGA